MKTVFADTFYFIALLYLNDQYHAQTVQLTRRLKARFLTTDWVLTEVADALSEVRARQQVAPLIRRIRESPVWEIIPFSQDQFDAALEFHSRHQDKEWPLIDCTSFLVMQERGIKEALTGDHHFEQAGFIALLK
jgi:predicted nucleic acid-binding protein